MKPVENPEEIMDHAEDLNERFRSVNEELDSVEDLEGAVSEEIQQAGKIISQLRGLDWSENAESAEEGELEAIRDLRKAAGNLQKVSSTLDDISRELQQDISDEESLIGRLEKIIEGVRSGKYTISGQGAEIFAETLNAAASEVMKSEEEVSEAKDDAERAVQEAEKMVELIKGDSSGKNLAEMLREHGLGEDYRKLEEIESMAEESLKNSRNASSRFEDFLDEVRKEEGVDDPERRDVLKFAASASAASIIGLSGCAGTEVGETPDISEPSVDRDNPWGTDTLVVAVSEGKQLIKGFPKMLENALQFWENNDERYLGYPINLSWRETPSKAHIRIAVREEVDRCGDITQAGLVGCTSFNSRGKDSTASIRIESGHSQELTLRTLKHEIGHVLGLSHSDEPQGIMSDNPSDRIENFETKDRIAQLFTRGMELHNSGIRIYRAGIELYRNENWRAAQEKFQEASKKFGRSSKRLDQALNMAEDIGENDAAEVISRGRQNAYHMAEATENLVESIEAGFNGNRGRREDLFESYQESFRAAQEVDAPSGEELRRALEF